MSGPGAVFGDPARGRWSVDVLVPVVGGLLLGLILVVRPPVALAAGVGVVGLGSLAVLASRSAFNPILLVVPAVIIGGMKFRYRLATESLAGAVDANILFELGTYGAVFFLVAFVAGSRRIGLLRPTWTEGWLYAYAAWAVISTAWSVSPAFTLVRGAQTCILLLAAVTLVRLVPLQRIISRASATYVGIIMIAALLSLMFPWARGIRHDWFTGSPRFAWFADHPIQVAVHCGLAAVLLLSLVLQQPSRRRGGDLGSAWPWMALVVVLGIMIATVSRGPVAAILATAAAMVAVRYLDLRESALAVSGVLALILATTLFASPLQALATLQVEEGGLMQMLLRERTGANLLSMGGRFELWSTAGAMALDRPLLGYGFIASRGPMLEQLAWAGHAHNGPLQSLLDLGVLGLVLLWVPVVVALVRGMRIRADTPARMLARVFIVGSLTFLILVSLTDPSLAGPPGVALLFGAIAMLIAERYASERVEGLRLT